MKRIYNILAVLHLFVGVGALFGGFGVIIDPSGKALGVTTDILKSGPFVDFLIPGLFLFIFLGIFDIIVAVFAFKKSHYQAYLSGIMGLGLMIFIAIQCIILDTINILHIIFFVLGLIEALFALVLALKTELFPFNLLKRM